MDARRLGHVWDDDACCIYCGFDAAEEYHLRITCVEPGERQPQPDWATYCKKRGAIQENCNEP
jgi:hypothetical protein